MGNRIGIDVGGTNVKIALVNEKGSIIYSNSIPTRAEMGYEYTINNTKPATENTAPIRCEIPTYWIFYLFHFRSSFYFKYHKNM